jgi:hypothetical protein
MWTRPISGSDAQQCKPRELIGLCRLCYRIFYVCRRNETLSIVLQLHSPPINFHQSFTRLRSVLVACCVCVLFRIDDAPVRSIKGPEINRFLVVPTIHFKCCAVVSGKIDALLISLNSTPRYHFVSAVISTKVSIVKERKSIVC